jgi:hypothetical protein
MSFLFDEFSQGFDKSKLTEEQLSTYNAANAEVDQDLLKEIKDKHKLFTGETLFGTYRIEVVYEHRRSSRQRSVALINVYKSNKNRSLDLDEPLFLCSSESDPSVGCGKVLTGEELAATLEDGSVIKVLWCDSCKKYVNRLLLCASLFMNNEPKTIAKRVYHLFRELNSDADIVITYNKHDMKKAQEDKQGKKLEKLRTERERAIYPLYRIVQDSEASILKRIEDFLSV